MAKLDNSPKLRNIYSALSKHYNSDIDPEVFANKMLDPANHQSVFDALSKHYKVDITPEEFSSKLAGELEERSDRQVGETFKVTLGVNPAIGGPVGAAVAGGLARVANNMLVRTPLQLVRQAVEVAQEGPREFEQEAIGRVEESKQELSPFVQAMMNTPSVTTMGVPQLTLTTLLETRKLVKDATEQTDVDDAVLKFVTGKLHENKRLENQTFPTPTGGVEKVADDVIGAVGSLAMAIGLTAATGSPIVPGIVFGAQQVAMTYEKAREVGMSPTDASDVAVAAGIAEGSLEYIGLGMFMKNYGGKVMSLINHGLIEGSEEFFQNMSTSGIEKLAGVDNSTWQDIFKESLYQSVIGFVLGSGANKIISQNQVNKLKAIGLDNEAAENIIYGLNEEARATFFDLLEDMRGNKIDNRYSYDNLKSLASNFNINVVDNPELFPANKQVVDGMVSVVKGKDGKVTNTAYIRTRNPLVLGHEIGHVLVQNNQLSVTSMNLNEMQNVWRVSKDLTAQDGIPTWLAKIGLRKQRPSKLTMNDDGYREAVADFIALYLHSPNLAHEAAPKTTEKMGPVIDRLLGVNQKPDVVTQEDGVRVIEDYVKANMEVLTERGLVFDRVEMGYIMVSNKAGSSQQLTIDELNSDFLNEFNQRYFKNQGEYFFEPVAQTTTKPTETTAVDPDVAMYKTKRGRLFGLATGKGVNKLALIHLLSKYTGKDQVKFSGDDKVSMDDLDTFIERLERIKPEWSDVRKEYYLKHGEQLLGEDVSGEPLELVRGGKLVNALHEFLVKEFQGNDTTLKKLGKHGAELNERCLQYLEAVEKGSKFYFSLTKKFTKGLSKESARKIMRFVKTGEGTLSKQERTRLDGVKEGIMATGQMAAALHIKTRTITKEGKIVKKSFQSLGDDYWPHVHKFDWAKSQKSKEKFISNLMTKHGLTQVEAERYSRYLVENRAHNLAPNLEFSRVFDLDGWYGDPDAADFSVKKVELGLLRYFTQSNRRLIEALLFDENGRNVYGNDWKSMNDIIGEELDENKRTLMGEIMSRIRNTDKKVRERPMLSALRNYQIMRLLGLAQIPNMLQTTITVLPKAQTFGFRRGVKIVYEGLREAATNPRFALDEVGIGVMQNIREITGMSDSGWSSKAASFYLKYIGFSATETVNNIIAASIGKVYIKEALKVAQGQPSGIFKIRPTKTMQKTAIVELEKMGVDTKKALETGVLSESEIQRASWRMAYITQFRGGAHSLPMFYSSDYGKVFNQFRTFSFNIVKFWKNEILMPAVKTGNFAPLIAWAGATALSGELIALIRSVLIMGRKRPEDLLGRVAEDLLYAGTLGLWVDILYAAKAARLTDMVAGPTAGQATEILKGMQSDIALTTLKQFPVLRQIVQAAQSRASNETIY